MLSFMLGCCEVFLLELGAAHAEFLQPVGSKCSADVHVDLTICMAHSISRSVNIIQKRLSLLQSSYTHTQGGPLQQPASLLARSHQLVVPQLHLQLLSNKCPAQALHECQFGR